MEKKNLDWANLGFGYMTTDTVTYPITKTANGMKEQLSQMKM